MLLESGVSEVGQGSEVRRETEVRWAVLWGSGGKQDWETEHWGQALGE